MKEQDKAIEDEASLEAQKLIREALSEIKEEEEQKEQAERKRSNFGFWFGLIIVLSVMVFVIGWWVIRPRLFPSSKEALVLKAQSLKVDESKTQIQYVRKGELDAIKKVMAAQYELGDNPFLKIKATVPRIVQFYVSQRLPGAYLSSINTLQDQENILAFIVSFNYQQVGSSPAPKSPTDIDIPPQLDLSLLQRKENLLQGQEKLAPNKEGLYSFQWRINSISETIGEESDLRPYNRYAKAALEYYENTIASLMGVR